MNEFTIRFLIIGSIITILIGFGVWWFFIHSSSDRVAEENGIKFVRAVDAACETNQPIYLDFQLPQPFAASLKEKVEEFFGWVSEKLSLGGKEVNIPLQTFNDPYYKIYWEYFPPDPPYSFGEGALETAASIFAPWHEDLPWSSNFMMTLTLDMLFLGIDILGIGEIKGVFFSKGKIVANKLINKINSISPDTLEKVKQIWNAIEEEKDLIVENLGKAEKVVIKGGKLVIEEGKFVGGVTSAYVVFCLITQDKTLGECLKDGVIIGIGMDISKIVLKKFVFDEIREKLAIKEATISFEELKSRLTSITNDNLDEAVSSFGEQNSQGWKYDESTGKLIASREDDVAKENIIEPLSEYARANDYPNRIDEFLLIYDDSKNLKEVIYDPKKLKDNLREKILYPIEKKLGALEEKIMSNKMLTSQGMGKLVKDAKSYFERDPERAKEFLRLAGLKIDDPNEALRILSIKLSRIEDEANKELFFVVVEKDSKLERVIFEIERGEAVTEAIEGYFDNILISKDSKEAKDFWNLLNGKRLRLKEDIEVFSHGTFGYMFLRIQDLYTPLGVSYWDRYFSYYGYPSLEAERKGFCRTNCDDGKICVQLGACVRQFDLPESCVNKGVTSIKIKRDSIVAKDPRFYLVSPCYAKLKMYVEGDVLYVEPYIKVGEKKSYCYATAGLVNWWIGSEIGAYMVRCVSASLCALTCVGCGVLDAITACLGLGKGFTGVCSIISNLAGLFVDLFRETVLIYPDVYKNMPDLIDFKL